MRRTDDRRQRTDDRRQRTEDRRQRTEDRRQKTEWIIELVDLELGGHEYSEFTMYD